MHANNKQKTTQTKHITNTNKKAALNEQCKQQRTKMRSNKTV